MNIILTILGLAAFVGLVVVTVEILVPTILFQLASWDSKYSPLILVPKAGEFYLLARGKGDYAGIIESVVDHEYKEHNGPGGRNHIFTPKAPDVVSKGKGNEGYLRKLGIQRKPLWTYPLYHEIKYDKWEKLENSETYGLVEKIRGNEKSGPSIYFRYNMAVKVPSVEIQGSFRVDSYIMFTTQLTNPVQAYFFAGGWESQTTGAVQTAFREYAQGKTWEILLNERTSGGSKDLIQKIKDLGGKGESQEDDLPNGLFALFGVEIIDARFVDIEPVKDPEVLKAMQAEEIAVRQANAEVAKAVGKRDSMKVEAEGIIADRKARSSVDGWETIEISDALRKTPLTALGGDIMTAITPKEKK